MNAWVKRAYIENLILVVINTVILGGSFFFLVGRNTNSLPFMTRLFFLLFVTFVTLHVPVEMIRNTRKAFLQGKWILEYRMEGGRGNKSLNPFRRVWPSAIPLGAGTALLLYLILWKTDASALPPTASIGIGFILTVLTTSILLSWHLASDMSAYASGIKRNRRERTKDNSGKPLMTYCFWNHLLPLSLITSMIGTSFGYKGFSQIALKEGGSIPVRLALGNFSVVGTIAAVWMWLISHQQAQLDVPLGIIKERKGRTPPTPVVLVLLLIAGISAGALVGLFASFAEIKVITVPQATALNAIVWVLWGNAGSLTGIWSGRSEKHPSR